MNAAPAAFRAELRSHNRQAIALTVLSFLAALLAWTLAYFFFVLVLLGLVTSVRGDFGPEMPAWIPGAAYALAGALCVWGLIDAHFRRYAPTSDRSIIGWHLIPDFLLLPVRITFAIAGNFSAIRRLSDPELDRAWELLHVIHRAGRAPIGSLRVVESEPAALQRYLSTLQLMRYVDLHPGKEDWFYTVCSPREPELRALTKESSF